MHGCLFELVMALLPTSVQKVVLLVLMLFILWVTIRSF